MKMDFRVRIEIVRKLECYEPTLANSGSGAGSVIACGRSDYYQEPANLATGDQYYHFPLIVGPGGALWGDANRYLLSRINAVVPAKHRTLETVAGDLAHFMQWCLEEEIDYLAVSSRPLARPTYRYCSYLHDEVRVGKLGPGTAKRRMSSLQNFYRWLELDGKHFNYPLWVESDAALAFFDSKGFQKKRPVKTTDLTRSFRITKSNTDFSEYIEDGGKLRPLPREEQVALVEALKTIGNTEMTLAFFLAMATGARLQTIFTLRRRNFSGEPYRGAVSQPVKVGNGTLVSTKYGKQMVLLIPIFLYRKIQVYMQSERCCKRVDASKREYPNEDEQYLFLTRSGQPYYMSENDPFARLYRSPPRGNAVTQFIRQQLKPELYHQGADFEFRFHDLRATFGMNLLESMIGQLSGKSQNSTPKPDLTKAIMLVRTRMGHSRIATTEGYLKYREKYHIALKLQDDYERYLESLLSGEVCDELG